MKWLPAVLIFLTSQPAFVQELSLHIPVTVDNRTDGGIQMAALTDGYLILVQCLCHENSNDYCLGLLRTDIQGQKIWSKVFDGSPDSNLNPAGWTLAVREDSVYVANEIWKTDHKEIRLMSFDLDGTLLNQQDLPIPYTSELQLRGMVENEQKLLVYGEVGNNGHRVFIIVLDLQLNIIEEHFIGNPSYNKRWMELSKLQDTGYVLAYGEAVISPQTSVVVAKLDEDFNVTLSKKMLQSGNPYISVNIFETADKGYMLAWQKDLQFTQVDTFPFPTAVYKLDSLLNVEWEYVFAHNSAKQHITAVKISDDKLLGIGATDYYGHNNIYPGRWSDGWCFLLDMEGNMLWEKSICDIRNSYGGRLWHGLETDGGFALVGDIDKVNPTEVPFLNDPEVWLLTLDEYGCWNGNCEEYIVITGDSTSITETKELPLTPPMLTIYPNPTSDILVLDCKSCETLTQRAVQIFDSNGKKVLEMNLYAPISYIRLTQLPDGIYFASHLIDKRPIETYKVVVHH